MPTPTTTPDLTACDREPITRLDRIQPFGFLIAMSNDWTVARASANLKRFLGVEPQAVIGERLDLFLSEQAIHDLRNRMAVLYSTGSERLYGVKLLKGKRQTYDLSVHFADGLLVLEGELSQPAAAGMEAASMVRAMIARLSATADLDAFHRDAARQIRAITGFDRVMIYRFEDSGVGEVIAESTRSGIDSFLGLHFPAADIPVQARALYLRNPFRIIADVSDQPVVLLPQTGAVQPLDLGLAVTRSVSPVHLEYLRNMGVGASLSISIVVDGRLWGLIACHNVQPRLPSFIMRTAAELFGHMFSMTLESRLHQAAVAVEQRIREVTDRLITAVAGDESLLSDPEWLQAISRDLIQSDGVAVFRNGQVFVNGATPPTADVLQLAKCLNATAASRVFDTDCLAEVHPACAATADRAAGMLAIPISRVPRDYIMLFRRERIRDIHWGGDPNKPVDVAEDGVRLSPRKSFAAFRHSVAGRCVGFESRDRRIGEAIRLAIIEVILRSSETAVDERRAAGQRQDLLIAELNHRVRNILALIRGLISQTGRSTADVAEYVDALSGRVQALARAHDQITRQNWGPGSVCELLEEEVAAHCHDGSARLVIEGDGVMLQPQAISTMALVIHELVANSVKHGALGHEGRVFVTFDHAQDEGIWMRWVERGGPPVQAPERRGFGSVILERSVPFDLHGKAELRFLLAGLEAEFFLPLKHIWRGTVRAAATAAGPDAPTGATSTDRRPLDGLRVLLLEDNMLIALETEDMLTVLGAESVTTCSSLAAADAALQAGTLDLAVLDVTIGAATSFDFARRLRADGVPFLFASGYGHQVALETEHSQAVVIQKPYGLEHLRAAVVQVQPAMAGEPLDRG